METGLSFLLGEPPQNDAPVLLMVSLKETTSKKKQIHSKTQIHNKKRTTPKKQIHPNASQTSPPTLPLTQLSSLSRSSRPPHPTPQPKNRLGLLLGCSFKNKTKPFLEPTPKTSHPYLWLKKNKQRLRRSESFGCGSKIG